MPVCVLAGKRHMTRGWRRMLSSRPPTFPHWNLRLWSNCDSMRPIERSVLLTLSSHDSYTSELWHRAKLGLPPHSFPISIVKPS